MFQEPITTLFLSQSTEHKKHVNEQEEDDDDVMVLFAGMQFNPKEYVCPMKQ